jgi:hypothetical protein
VRPRRTVSIAVARDDFGLQMSALVALIGAEVGMLVVGHAFKPDKPRRLGTEFAFRARQGGKRLGLGGGTSDLGLLFHAALCSRTGPSGKPKSKFFV